MRRAPRAQGSYLFLIVINSISKLRKLDIREAQHWQNCPQVHMNNWFLTLFMIFATDVSLKMCL